MTGPDIQPTRPAGDSPYPAALGRRLLTIPALLLATLALTVAGPVLIVVAAVIDLVAGGGRWPTLRLYAFATGYAWAETIGLVVALVIWLIPGSRSTRQNRNHRLQSWWARLLVNLADPVLGLRLRVHATTEPVTSPGPLLVLAHHASIVDALVPAWLFGSRHGRNLRYVLARGLRLDPCLDVVGHRVPTHFVRRGSGDSQAEAAAVGRIGRAMGPDDVAVIFPGGGIASPERRERAMTRLAEVDPAAASRAEALRHTLPPRPAGTLALMRSAPDADVTVVGHHGFEAVGSLRPGDLWRRLPFAQPVDITMRHFPREEVPTDDEGRAAWLLDRWVEMDEAIDEFATLRTVRP